MRIDFLHATGDRGESLSLDIAEIFKPLIVDRSIFTLINKGMIDADRHFREVENEGTYLSCIKEEIGKINRLVVEGKEYKAYRYDGRGVTRFPSC